MRRMMTGLNIAFSLMLAILVFQETKQQLGLTLSAIVSTTWFFLSVALILTVHPFFGRKNVQPPRLPIEVHTSDGVVSLQHQLKLCLEYGDVETADKISKKLQKAAQLAQADSAAEDLPEHKRQAAELNRLFYSSK